MGTRTRFTGGFDEGRCLALELVQDIASAGSGTWGRGGGRSNGHTGVGEIEMRQGIHRDWLVEHPVILRERKE